MDASCIYGYSSKDDLLTSLNDIADDDFKKRISEASLEQVTLYEVQKFYAKTRQPESSYGYHFLPNNNLLLSGIITYNSSCFLGEAHPNYWQYATTINLTTGKDITLWDFIHVDASFLHFIKKRIQMDYNGSVDGSDKQNNERGCWQYIRDEYLTSYDKKKKNDEYNTALLAGETSFSIQSGSLDILPRWYPHTTAGICAGTVIHLSSQEIIHYFRKDTPDLITRIFPQ